MSTATGSYWQHDPRRQHALGSTSYPPNQYAQQPLQLESLHEQVGFDSLMSYPAGPVSTSRGHGHDAFSATTATSLAAQDNLNSRLPYGYNKLNGSIGQQGLSHGPSITAVDAFNANFTFTSPSQTSATAVENVSPHVVSTQSQADDYNSARLSLSLHQNHLSKRRREDTLDANSSGDYQDGDFGDTFEDYDHYPQVTGSGSGNAYNMQSPEQHQHGASLHAISRGSENPHSTDGNGNPQLGTDGKSKQVHRAACVRCRSLKVRCESTSDPNACRRCLNGGHECAIPGKKKRRQPPKREHLMNQIRDQAQEKDQLRQEIERLRRELEKIGRPLHEPARLSLSNTPLPHPGAPPAESLSHTSGSHQTPGPEVQEWIERAREYIITSGGGLVDEGSLLEPVEEEDQYDTGEDYEEDEETYTEGAQSGQETSEGEINRIAIEDPNGVRSPEAGTRHLSPTSTVLSGSREGSAPPGQVRRKGSGRRRTPQQAPVLPQNPAVPMTLIASLASCKSKSPRSTGAFSRGGSVDPPESTGSPGVVSPSDAGVDENDSAAPSQTKDEDAYGAAAPEFFKARKGSIGDPSRLAPARQPIPHILMRGVVTPKEVEILFHIYFEKMNLSCSLLDPILYTAKATYWRSPFLFTVVCAVASRYYSAGRPGLYDELMTYAQLAAGTALISGPKNVETVSAYILLSLYPIPMRRWEEDRTWLYLGLAIRVATDLNLNQPTSVKPKNELHARELLNRTRVWLNCYNLDRSTASWHGKASTIATRDYIACHSEEWYESSEFNMRNFDIQLVAYNENLRCMSEFKEKIYSDPTSPTGINKDLDFIELATVTDERLRNMETKWVRLFKDKTNPEDEQGRFRCSLVRLALSYNRLVSLAFGLQYSFEKASAEDIKKSFFGRCYKAAEDVIGVFIDELTNQREYIRHGPEAQSVFVVFASAIMIKLLHPKYGSYLKQEQRAQIHDLVRRLIDLLSSDEVVVDDKHSPKLWSRFLDGLLATPNARIELPSMSTKTEGGTARKSRRKSASHATNQSTTSTPSTPQHVDQHSMTSQPLVTSPMLAQTSFFDPQLADMPSSYNIPYSASNSSSGGYQMVSPQNSLHQGQPSLEQGRNETEFMSGMYDADPAFKLNVPEYFQPAFPFGQELQQSVQAMDASLWQNVPCLNWMSALQNPETDTSMQDAFGINPIGFDAPPLNF